MTHRTSHVFVAFALLISILLSSPARAEKWEPLPEFDFTAEGAKFKLRREFTALGFEPETTRESILEFIRSKRGGSDPLVRDDDNPDQLVLVDAKGKKWKAEIDGGVVEIQDAFGRFPKVFESKASWFKNSGLHRMHLVLDALLGAGAKPSYAYGGGHIHLKVVPYFQSHPIAFASLINLALTYEPILMHLMTHQRRIDNTRSLTFTRMNAEQKSAAGIQTNQSVTLAEYLGNGLNRILRGEAADCRKDSRFSDFLKWDAGLSEREICILAFMAHFGTRVVGDRVYAINLQSWRGAQSARKRHDSVEFRLFNAPHNHIETALEERLVRLLADRAVRASTAPIEYVPKVSPVYDLDSYFLAYFPEQRERQLRSLLQTVGMDEASIKLYSDEYLDEQKHARRRWEPETGL